MTSPRPPDQAPSGVSPEAPPLFRSWGTWYAIVLAFLALLILAFTLLGRVYS